MSRPDSRVLTNAAEIRAAAKHARAATKTATAITAARYAKTSDSIVVQLNTGSTISIPRKQIPGFGKLQPASLGAPLIEPPGNSLWFEKPDIGVRLETLMIVAAGERTVRSAAAQLLGSHTSARKAHASATNGRLGGRPAKKKGVAA